MADLRWPGDHRAGDLFTDTELIGDMLRVETAWLAALTAVGVAPAQSAVVDIENLVGPIDPDEIAVQAEAGGNPVIPLLAVVRDRLADDHPVAARWLHRGLTSQDTLDTAIVLGLRRCVGSVLELIDDQVTALVGLAEEHRSTVMAGRTLTQHAVPITFGLKAAQWLQGILDARDDLRDARDRLPAQFGGAAGTLAGPGLLLQLTGGTGDAISLTRVAADRLGLPWAPPWHTARAPITRVADALTRTTDAWGRAARDVLVLARPEIAELAEPVESGRGGSSTMPHKVNPILSVLIRRAALTAPGHAAQLHLAAADSVDERADGAWHTEWSTIATLGRHTVTAASQTAELLTGLHVDTGRMARLVDSAGSTLLAEQRRLAGFIGTTADDFDPAHYLGSSDAIIDVILERARSGGSR
jgi:Adenylosuccinate lyase